MWRRSLLVGILLLVPHVSRAQEVPERLLPGGSQLYLRWDGMDKHRAAFDKTAVGQMLKDDTGKFLGELWSYLNQLSDVALAKADPNVAALVKEIPPILAGVHHNGFLLGVEVRSILPPDVETVLVFPKAGGPKGSLVPLVEKLAKLAKADVKQTKVGSRRVNVIDGGPVQFGWWQEANNDVNVADVVFVFGTSSPVERAKAVEAGKDTYAQSKNYATLKAFKEFPTWMQAYLDMASLMKKVGDLNSAADQIIGDLGLKGLTSVTMHSGFSGDAERTVVEINTPDSRKGLLALMNKKKISLTNLPPLPNDITGFSVSNFNPRNIYDGGLVIAQAVTNVFLPGADPKEIVRQVEAVLGVKFGEDLFGTFDDLFVTYSSPAEGPFGLGSVYLFKLKDEKKLRTTLDGLFKSIPGAIPFVPIEILYKKARLPRRRDHGIEGQKSPGRILDRQHDDPQRLVHAGQLPAIAVWLHSAQQGRFADLQDGRKINQGSVGLPQGIHGYFRVRSEADHDSDLVRGTGAIQPGQHGSTHRVAGRRFLTSPRYPTPKTPSAAYFQISPSPRMTARKSAWKRERRWRYRFNSRHHAPRAEYSSRGA